MVGTGWDRASSLDDRSGYCYGSDSVFPIWTFSGHNRRSIWPNLGKLDQCDLFYNSCGSYVLGGTQASAKLGTFIYREIKKNGPIHAFLRAECVHGRIYSAINSFCASPSSQCGFGHQPDAYWKLCSGYFNRKNTGHVCICVHG